MIGFLFIININSKITYNKFVYNIYLIVYLYSDKNKQIKIMKTIINITNQAELNLNVKDCKKLQKQIQKLKEKLNKTIEEFNNKAYSISLCTEEYKDILKIIK